MFEWMVWTLPTAVFFIAVGIAVAWFAKRLEVVPGGLLGVVLGHGLYGFILGYGLAAYGTAIPGTIYFFSGIWKRRAPYLAEPEPQDTPS